VDFQKAFDCVWRDGLLYKLAKIGIGKYFYSTVKNMLYKTEIYSIALGIVLFLKSN
jgi:hypothetical protein